MKSQHHGLHNTCGSGGETKGGGRGRLLFAGLNNKSANLAHGGRPGRGILPADLVSTLVNTFDIAENLLVALDLIQNQDFGRFKKNLNFGAKK